MTLTLNPALDRYPEFDVPFKSGTLNRMKGSRWTNGGKGLNVSRALAAMGADAPAYAFVGGEEGDKLRDLLLDEMNSLGCSFPLRFVKTDAPTRTNIKLMGEGGVYTEINESGGPVTDDEVYSMRSFYVRGLKNPDAAESKNALRPGGAPGGMPMMGAPGGEIPDYIAAMMRGAQPEKPTVVAVISGSLPGGMDIASFTQLVRDVRRSAEAVVLDLSGSALCTVLDEIRDGVCEEAVDLTLEQIHDAQYNPYTDFDYVPARTPLTDPSEPMTSLILIKPNSDELASVCAHLGIELSEGGEAAAAKRIYEICGVSVLCTMGGRGAVYAGDARWAAPDSGEIESAFVSAAADAVRVDAPVTFAGAGDCFLGSFIGYIGREGGESADGAQRIAAAMAFAAERAAELIKKPIFD